LSVIDARTGNFVRYAISSMGLSVITRDASSWWYLCERDCM